MTETAAMTRAPAPGGGSDALGPTGSVNVTALTAAARAVVRDAAAAVGWSAAQRSQALAELDRVGDLLTAARGRILTAERDAGTWAGRGDRDLAGWRGRTSRTGMREAAAQVREAEALETMPQVERALTGGTVRAGHVGVLARAAATVPENVGAVMRSPAGQTELLALATDRDTRDFARAVDRWVARQDPATVQRTHDVQRERRFLHLSHTPGGTHIKGLLDSVAGHTLQLALEAASPRPAAEDHRTAEQRRADGLTTLAEHLLTDRDTTPGAMVRPHVSVVLREETWRALRSPRRDGAERAQGSARVTGEKVAVREEGGSERGSGAENAAPEEGGRAASGSLVDVLQGVPAPTTEDGVPLPATEVARILCDCELTRIVVDTAGTPVDLGRTARLHSATQRRAVAHRDGGCAWTGCAIPARWSEVHHLRWWTRDHGATSVDNGILLCSFHHHEVHRQDISITRLPARVPGGPHPSATTARAIATYIFTLPDGRIVAGPDRGGAGGENRGPRAGGADRGPPTGGPDPVPRAVGDDRGPPTGGQDQAPRAGPESQPRSRPRQIEPGSSAYSPYRSMAR